jgi:hypothetical protein
MNLRIIILVFILVFSRVNIIFSQVNDIEIKHTIKKFYSSALVNGKCYEWLGHLSKQIGGRLSGSLNLERAILWAEQELSEIGLDSVWLQPVMVPKWVRGTFEYASIESSPGNSINVPICALGGSISTPFSGISANVIEVRSFEELDSLGFENVNNKIVFFNKAMPANLINTFDSYSKTVNQRYDGARIASKYGAIAVIVRSLNLSLDDFPHTGTMSYGDLPIRERIPAASISTNGAELLSSMLSLNPEIKFFFKQNCKNYPDVLSYNVIGQINGLKNNNKILLVGAHLDSWDLGEGAHDDGAGVVQSMEVLRLLKINNYKPLNTIRVVLFTNEENGLRGAKKYAELSYLNNENHVFAIESDAGGFTPRGFSIETNNEDFKKIKKWKPFFRPYQINFFERGESGPDIKFLKTKENILIGLRPDSQRYFEYHHSANDTFDAINKRELELGAASMVSLIYLADYFDL